MTPLRGKTIQPEFVRSIMKSSIDRTIRLIAEGQRISAATWLLMCFNWSASPEGFSDWNTEWLKLDRNAEPDIELIPRLKFYRDLMDKVKAA